MEDKIYNKCVIAFDKLTQEIVLLSDLTGNIIEGKEVKEGISWKELIEDCGFKFDEKLQELKSGIYVIEFTAWGYKENSEACSYGNSEFKIISVKNINQEEPAISFDAGIKKSKEDILKKINWEIKDCKTLKRLTIERIKENADCKNTNQIEWVVNNFNYVLKQNYAIFRLEGLKEKILGNSK